ncbi:MAG: hypothetical protein PVI30_10740 [Myxococcales bacterium]|jgi:hypothetical protein
MTISTYILALGLIGLLANLLAVYQVRDRLDRIADLMEKSKD